MSSSSESVSSAEQHAEEARADLVGTLNQLRENLKPANVVDEVMTSAKVNASAVTDQVWETARKNPLPALMIGAGLAMILGVGTRYGAGSLSSARPKVPARARGAAPEVGATRSAPGQAGASIGGTVSALADTARQSGSTLLDAANSTLSSALDRGTAAAGTAYSNATRSSPMSWSRRNVGASLTQLIEEQPLVLAAVGIAVGAALGAALPTTEAENSLLGETSHSVKDAAQGLVKDQIAQVKFAAAHAVDDIKQSVAEHGVTADNLSGLARDIGDKAKAATYEAGRSGPRV